MAVTSLYGICRHSIGHTRGVSLCLDMINRARLTLACRSTILPFVTRAVVTIARSRQGQRLAKPRPSFTTQEHSVSFRSVQGGSAAIQALYYAFR